jgi:glycerol-3-phosphate dehydrogenase subunit C
MADLTTSGKVAYYHGCFANYYYPQAGEATLAILKKNGIEVEVPRQVCCGLPMMAKGNVKDAMANMRRNAGVLSKLVSDGYAVVVSCSSCGLFLKRDSPHLLQTDAARLVAENLYHITEYLLKLNEAGHLNKELAGLR